LIADCALKEERTKEQARIEQERLDLENRRTFKKTFDEWILTIRRKDGGTELVRTFEKDVFPYLADKTLLDIKKSDLLSLLDRVVNRGARVLANHLFADMKQFFTWCENRDLIDKHPLRGLKKTDIGGTQRERERVLSTAELIQLRDKLPAAHMERQTEIAIWLMLSTLARVGELSQARWEHVDLESGTWTIPAGNSKNAKEHTIFLSGFATRFFAELHVMTRDSGWVFPSARQGVVGHICLRSISKQIKDRQRETALTNRSLKGLGALTLPGGGWTAHDLRRTGATMMGELGVASEVIERCLNHIETSKLKRTYQRHELKAERREAWARLGEQLDNLIYGKERTIIPMRRAG